MNKKLGILAMVTAFAFVVFAVSLGTEPKGCPDHYHFLTNAAGYIWMGGFFVLTVITAVRTFADE